MNNNSLLLVDPDFEPQHTENCRLLLKIAEDSFSYAILDKNRNQLKAVFDKQECADVAKELTQAFKTDAYLLADYKDSLASVYTPDFAFIPDALFDNSRLSDYSSFLSTENEGKIYKQSHTGQGFNTVFKLSPEIDKILPEKIKRYTQASPLLNLVNHMEGKALILDFTAKSFNALYTEDHKVVFQNHYQIENVAEFNYFLLLIIEQLQLDAGKTNVYIQGIIHEGDELFNCIKKYFEPVFFFLPIGGQTDMAILDDMPAHYYSSLLALDLCE